jgi:hypothetical protein
METRRELMEAVARIFRLMSTQPNARSTPRTQDLQGHFDLWFDGGAVKHDTGISSWRFDDGATATTITSLHWFVDITLASSRTIHVAETRATK